MVLILSVLAKNLFVLYYRFITIKVRFLMDQIIKVAWDLNENSVEHALMVKASEADDNRLVG